MRILLLSAYDAVSHRYWREGLVENFAEHEWHSLYLAPRYYSWRLRGNPLSWYAEFADKNTHTLQQSFDLIIATSMVDISTLRGLFPNLANTPLCVYCHENQFAYPTNNENIQHQKNNRVEAQMVFIYACLAADKLVFNSQFNRDSALEGMQNLLHRLPEKISPAIMQKIKNKSMLLSVPLQDKAIANKNAVKIHKLNKKPLVIVWNHRWEFDKGPLNLLACVEQLAQQNCSIKWHIIGQQFRQQPEEFSAIKKIISDSNTMCIGRWGFIADQVDYLQLLRESDVVLSTALHDFQGLAVLEAVQQGCVPLVPKRLAYPEIFAADFLYAKGQENAPIADSALASSLQLEAKSAAEKITLWMQKGLPEPPKLDEYTWSQLKEPYASLLHSLNKRKKTV